MTTQRILSGIQPTGSLHLGNYIGAVKQWLQLQHQNNTENFFCIVDLHALTTINKDFKPNDLRDSVTSTLAAYIAAGIDPQQSCLFRQSDIPEHSELQWLLSCLTPMGWLNRMTQYKDKSAKYKQHNMLGLYSYPVLMAADILLYDTTQVPVGEDQKQHIELTRELAQSVNARFDANIFTLPEPYIASAAPRVMSLRDGTKKMSKSDISDNSRINMSDSNDVIAKKISKAKTDIIEGIFRAEDRPEINNLLKIFSALTGKHITDIEDTYRSTGAAVFKKDLTDAVIEDISPIRDTMHELLSNEQQFLTATLSSGAEKARDHAERVLLRTQQALGLR